MCTHMDMYRSHTYIETHTKVRLTHCEKECTTVTKAGQSHVSLRPDKPPPLFFFEMFFVLPSLHRPAAGSNYFTPDLPCLSCLPASPSPPLPPRLSLPQAVKSTNMWDLNRTTAVWGHKVGKPGMVGPFCYLSTHED